MAVELDVTRVVCRLSELDGGGARGFTIGGAAWPLRGLVVRVGDRVYGYLNRCPHAGHPLDLRPQQLLTPDGTLILCSSHGALFEKASGFCVAGPCAGRSLSPVPLQVRCGFVMLADSVDVDALAAELP
jgi:nitrite reductase/ring-hydroxylating ferredoxin subunit